MPDLSPEDQSEIRRITDEIMQGTELKRDAFRRYIEQILIREFMATQQAYDAGLSLSEFPADSR
jgi:hypothetical protein